MADQGHGSSTRMLLEKNTDRPEYDGDEGEGEGGDGTSAHLGKDQDDGDLSLPRQTVAKLVGELLAPRDTGFTCPRDTRDLLVACCTEFVHLIASEANEVCERAGRKTIAPEHLLEALRNLGFAEYCREVELTWTDQQEQARVRAERQKARQQPAAGAGLTEEELARQQAELFEKARLKYTSAHSSTAVANESEQLAGTASRSNESEQ